MTYSIAGRRPGPPSPEITGRVLRALEDGVSIIDCMRRFRQAGVSERQIRAIAKEHGIDIAALRLKNSLDLRGKPLAVKGCPSCDRTRAATPEEFPPRDGDEGIGRLCATCEAGRVLNMEARQ
jgi:hypothetical protein